MARRVGCRLGGIQGLLEHVDRHREAVEFDLLEHGFRLRDVGGDRFNWRDLFVLVRRWANQPGSALSESVHGHRLWSDDTELSAATVDALHTGNWQRAQRKTAPKPKPVPRPGAKAAGSRTLGTDPIPASEFNDWWNAKR
jgi:hypothetical protein